MVCRENPSPVLLLRLACLEARHSVANLVEVVALELPFGTYLQDSLSWRW